VKGLFHKIQCIPYRILTQKIDELMSTCLSLITEKSELMRDAGLLDGSHRNERSYSSCPDMKFCHTWG
jgi:hypothetical protein